jgi:hypothetical protein
VDRSGRVFFSGAKCLLAAVVPLQHPAPMLSFLCPLMPSEGLCNKSQETIGVPSVFFLKNLNSIESYYSTFDQELLAAYFIHLSFLPFL